MFYENKINWVIDAQGEYLFPVLMFLMPSVPAENNAPPTPDTPMKWVVQDYTLQDGESLVEIQPPQERVHAGDKNGVVIRYWDGLGWTEGATAEEIATWELEHPAPEPPAPSAQEDADAMMVDHELRLTFLELGVN